MSDGTPAIARGTITPLSFKKPALRISLIILVGLMGVFVSGDATRAQVPPMPPEKVVKILGQHIHYYEAGKGENIILLHGLALRQTSGRPTFPRFHLTIMSWFPTSWGSEPPTNHPSITRFKPGWSSWICSCWPSIFPKPLSWATRWGAGSRVDFARQHPGKVDRLVLADAAGWRPLRCLHLWRELNDASIAGIRQVLEMMLFERRAIPVDLNPGSLQETRKMMEFIVFDKKLITNQIVEQEFQRHLKNRRRAYD